MKVVRTIVQACFLGSISFAVTAKTQEIPKGWKTECVGYFKISVPGEVDIGIARGGSDPSKLSQAVHTGDYDLFEDSIYLDGLIRISSMLPRAGFLRLKDERLEFVKASREGKTEHSPIKDSDYAFKKNSLSYSYTDKYYNVKGVTFIYGARRIYYYAQSKGEFSPTDPEAKVKSDQAHFLKNFRPRARYQIPREKGFCMPYGFVKDDRPQKRSMGTIMRLKKHPDVRILFRDQSASLLESYSMEQNPTVENELLAFWERPDWGGVNYKALGLNKFPSVQMGGYKGQSTFVEITRPTRTPTELCSWSDEYFSKADKKAAGCLPRTMDYGYIAYVKGDPDAKEDTPNLLLYVMQDSENAPDGKPTIGKDELRKMAETIAASIKRR
ncbi:T6SS immunity protein Tli4 family protein [Pseudomonas sp.]|uniref:T6SS immunity protein Tli4 family protein n=1 Tax=Pseudomonas sp. TaxID=306 RepID=UPI0026117A22|nr:T6SS immunity protein Tli4 family protein [Pseudomonas sp.]